MNQKNSDIAISVSHVSKTFKIPHEKISSLRGAAIGVFKKKSYERFKALDDVSFEVKKGEFFACLGGRRGIIGRNGSGKSTLLKILVRIANLKEKGLVSGISLCSTCVGLLSFLAIDRMSECATISLLKSPVLTLWAWRGFILQSKTI